jgi:hypothetical protein
MFVVSNEELGLTPRIEGMLLVGPGTFFGRIKRIKIANNPKAIIRPSINPAWC